jgi:hypothetical protein
MAFQFPAIAGAIGGRSQIDYHFPIPQMQRAQSSIQIPEKRINGIIETGGFVQSALGTN